MYMQMAGDPRAGGLGYVDAYIIAIRLQDFIQEFIYPVQGFK